ncbi:Helicase SWR1 like protein [Verticillium longisporum]|nr:Helicase SWR1 like protein [Verticillium longisporum]
MPAARPLHPRPLRSLVDPQAEPPPLESPENEHPLRPPIPLGTQRAHEDLRAAPSTKMPRLRSRSRYAPPKYWAKATQIPLQDGGYLAAEEQYTDTMAEEDARTILRIQNAVEPGGILSEGQCTAFVPEPEEEPPRQWAHQDHMVKAAINFRKLMLAERQRHKTQAKRLAEACRDAWLRRQPKSAEVLEAEARDYWITRYRIVAKVMHGTWENVRAEINRRRLQEWEVEEQRRVKAALNEAVNLSEQKLQAQRGQIGSDEDEEDDEEDSEDDLAPTDDEKALGHDSASSMDADDDDSGDDDVMSSSDEDDEPANDSLVDAADETLTQDQLRAKYSNIPDLVKEDEDKTANGIRISPGATTGGDGGSDSTDESIDMDDDMGSSDEGSDEDDDDDMETGSGSELESDEGEPANLLGLFFDKKELQQMQETPEGETEDRSEQPSEQDDKKKALKTPSKPRDLPLPAWDFGKKHDVSLALHDDMEDEDDDEPELVTIPPSDPVTGDDTPDVGDGERPTTNGHVETAVVDEPVTNGIAHSLEATPDATIATSQDVDMTDAPVPLESLPELAITSPQSTPAKPTSSGADTMMAPPEAGKPTSSPTLDSKPSEADSTALIPAPKDDTSRSVSPSPASAAKTEVPFLLRGTLREYQHFGLDWLAGLYANNTNGILADEMGLGKTIQTIALLAHLACHHEVWGPHLVVVPTSVMLNWEMEFKKFLPGFKILSYYGTQEERKRKRHGWNNDDVWNVCITSYQLVLQDQQVFKRRKWHYLILDEAHNIKNFKSQRWQTLLGFNTRARLLLTGTPLQNNLTELWSLLFFLMPSENGVGGFADLQEFHDWFHKPESQILESGRETMDEEARAIISKLHKVLRPYLLRRLKADVEKQMPAKYEHVEFCRLSKRQRELYDGFLARADTRDTLASGNYMSIINCLMQLRKVCNHPDLFVDRPIMTSFRMQKSVAADYNDTNEFLQRTILAQDAMKLVSLGVVNLIPTQHEGLSSTVAERISQLSLHRVLLDLREAQNARAHMARTNLDPSTAESNLVYLESLGRWRRFEELQHCVYLNALRGQRRPIYGKRLVQFLTLDLQQRPRKPRPRVAKNILNWFSEDSGFLRATIHSMDDRAASMETTIQKFACVTPSVITRDMTEIVLGKRAIDAFTEADLSLSAPVRWAPFMQKQAPHDPWHEARMRLSIQFPDKRLLQYDCGKLQALDKLLRKLQAGGHRALIFTQMTKVLNILEQFLNIHGHKYLRLDGATKVEQRQILTDRFNNDPRILCFILSTRSGGLGINLTGADTVIFYDQDWNPAMDKQCQDRCHRIGQTRDVHIYRLVSEHTIEANILRKASQKQMLDDVVIQEGEFTTDYFREKMTVRDAVGEDAELVNDGNAAANAAMDRLLGGGANGSESRNVGEVLELAEDKEDVAAAKAAEKEIQADDADFQERTSGVNSGAPSTRQGTPRDDPSADAAGTGPGPSGLGRFSESAAPDASGEPAEVETNAWGERMRTIDDYMLRVMGEQLKGTVLELPKDKKKGKKKKGKDMRKR